MPYLLAIDQSTSATKAILFDALGNLVDKSSIEHRQYYPQPGFVEHDAEEIWNNTLAALRDLSGRQVGKLAEVACLSITVQRETFVVFDRKTGKPLHPAIVWQCRRGESICAELRQAGVQETISSKTGLCIDTYFSAPKLAWLIRNNPQIANALADGDALFGTIDAYLMYRLTGGKTFATDHTNASRTLLFDIRRLQWDEELCRSFGVPMRCLPDVRDSSASFGTTDAAGILPNAVPIHGVIGDSQASLFAHRCFSSGQGKMTLGTGSSILLNIGSDCRAAGEGAVTTIAWTHHSKPTYCFEGIINYAAGTIAWLKDQLGLIRSADETEGLCNSVPDNGGVYLVPAFAGLSAPHWAPQARAAIVGMTAHSDRRHIVRAAVESIAYQIADVLEMMAQRGGVDLGALRADGGASRNKFLMQFIADMTAREVTAAQFAECSPLGAALLGGLGIGLFSSLHEIERLPNAGESFSTRMPAGSISTLRAGWNRAIRQVLAGTQSKAPCPF
jgi:glycerol kinase